MKSYRTEKEGARYAATYPRHLISSRVSFTSRAYIMLVSETTFDDFSPRTTPCFFLVKSLAKRSAVGYHTLVIPLHTYVKWYRAMTG